MLDATQLSELEEQLRSELDSRLEEILSLLNRTEKLEAFLELIGLKSLLFHDSIYETFKNGTIVVIGASPVKEAVLSAIGEQLGISRDRFEFHLEYKDVQSLNVSNFRYNLNYYHASNDRYINEENHAISLLSMKKQLLEEQIPELKKPKGMKSGLVIFALFSVFCIIVPLGMSPFTTDNFLWYNCVKWVVMGLFVVGLVSIFSYLIYLLSWKNEGVMARETRSELQMKHYSVDTTSKN